MNREEVIRKVIGCLTDCYALDDDGEGEELIEALKQILKEPILDKIKTEIEQSYCTPNNDYDHGRNYGLCMATQIIDKYKAENEDDEQILDYTDQDTMMSAT